MKLKISKRNLIFLAIIVLLLIPQIRNPIQVLLHKGLSFFNNSNIFLSKLEILLYVDIDVIAFGCIPFL